MYMGLFTCIMAQGDCVECDVIYESDGRPVGDAEYFAVIRGAMKVLNFTSEDEGNIWRTVATVMHLGNIIFGGELVGFSVQLTL